MERHNSNRYLALSMHHPRGNSHWCEAAGDVSGAPGFAYQRALQLSIPIVRPHWIFACHSERTLLDPPNPTLTPDPL